MVLLEAFRQILNFFLHMVKYFGGYFPRMKS